MRADKHISASLWDAPFGLSPFSHAQTPKTPPFCSLFLTSILIFLFATSFSYSQTTGHSNVTISDAATVNGVWSGDGSSGYVFTPTADNANIKTTDIENRL
ncbi:MAG: hypothetical protein MRY51_05080, partial [Flavobacteriaceae bacterium]|nr:hypothetical protein [Flavobacteriaceae bacterium]MCI5088212.1 hypothetical protein [Flavobacteriaceae bacterium]